MPGRHVTEDTHVSGVAAERVRVGLANQRERAAELESELREHLRDTSLSVDVGEHGWAAETDGAGTESEQGDNVGGTADTCQIYVNSCFARGSLKVCALNSPPST